MEEERVEREKCACLRRETGSSGMRCLGGEGRGRSRACFVRTHTHTPLAVCGERERERRERDVGRTGESLCAWSQWGTRGEREPGGQTRNGESADECIDKFSKSRFAAQSTNSLQPAPLGLDRLPRVLCRLRKLVAVEVELLELRQRALPNRLRGGPRPGRQSGWLGGGVA